MQKAFLPLGLERDSWENGAAQASLNVKEPFEAELLESGFFLGEVLLGQALEAAIGAVVGNKLV